ncbi:MAG: hypothetical protein ACREDJ_11320, partial [Methylocella sp.]
EGKSQAPPDIQALRRARERLAPERAALINPLRALLRERGIVAAQGRRKLEEQLSTFADEDEIDALSARIRILIEDPRAEWRALDERIAAFDAEFVRMARNDETARRRPTSSRASPARFWRTAMPMMPAAKRRRHAKIARAAFVAPAGRGSLREVKGRWPDSRTAA